MSGGGGYSLRAAAQVPVTQAQMLVGWTRCGFDRAFAPAAGACQTVKWLVPVAPALSPGSQLPPLLHFPLSSRAATFDERIKAGLLAHRPVKAEQGPTRSQVGGGGEVLQAHASGN